MKKEDTPPSKSAEKKHETKEGEPTEKPKFALFSKNVTGKEILARLGITPKK